MPVILILCVLFFIGCSPSPTLPKNVVAKVNNYMITTDEFRQALNASRAVFKNYPDLTPQAVNEKVLDEMIVNQLLLEEAQKLNFDKQEAFMREVESYWRQALLKALLREKNKEFLAAGNVPDEQLRELYDRQGTQLELDITTLADEAAAQDVAGAGDAFEDRIKTLGTRVLHRETGWWQSGDLPMAVEKSIWALETHAVSKPLLMPGEGWMVVRVISKEQRQQRPFDEMAAALRKRLAAQKSQVMMDRWIGELRARAVIVKELP